MRHRSTHAVEDRLIHVRLPSRTKAHYPLSPFSPLPLECRSALFLALCSLLGDDRLLARQIGARVRHLRQKRGLSQEAFAERCDIHRTYIGAIERGEKMMTISTASKLASALGLSLAQLFDGLETPARLPSAHDDMPIATQPATQGARLFIGAMGARRAMFHESV